MNDEECPLKIDRISHENEHMSFDFIKSAAELIINNLTAWANKEIYSQVNGVLTSSISSNDTLNASATVYAKDYLNPSIIINMGIIWESYRDSLTFNIVSKRIEVETKHIEILNEEYTDLTDFVFEEGCPVMPVDRLCSLAKLMEERRETVDDDRLTNNDYNVRFSMFELMITWIFFHELSHLIQCHYIFKKTDIKDEITCHELEEKKSELGVAHKSREILADLEGLGLTMKYILEKNIYHRGNAYLLLCSISCMFHRFHGEYDNNIDVSESGHPHPFIRNEYIHTLFLRYTKTIIEESENETNIKNDLGLVYLSTRSMLFTVIFWKHRMLKESEDVLPAFMKYQSEADGKRINEYQSELNTAIRKSLLIIKKNHLYEDSIIKNINTNGYFQ